MENPIKSLGGTTIFGNIHFAPKKVLSSKDVRFRLWGLTLRATADALVLGDAPELSWPPMKFRFEVEPRV